MRQIAPASRTGLYIMEAIEGWWRPFGPPRWGRRPVNGVIHRPRPLAAQDGRQGRAKFKAPHGAVQGGI